MDKLGKYEVVDKIGVGGFGVVYKGYDPYIKRHVAIKTCSAEDTETRERFVREAEIAGNLQHRNIVTVFEFGYQEETPYLVQEFLTGEDLDHKIKRRDAIPLAEKVGWLIEVGRGLEFAHRRGVVHRDIKPGNIRILHDNAAKILDFGIAKLAQQQSTLTQAGVTLGTASYLAPEQIRGEAVDSRTDVFSFGVLAYELLTYERPFRAQEISALFYKLINENPAPPSSRAAGIPAELDEIVLRCIEKDPARRFSPTSELVQVLERFARRPPGADAGHQDLDGMTHSSSHDEKTSVYAATRALASTPAALPPPSPTEPTIATQTPSEGHRLSDLVLDTHISDARPESFGMSPPRGGRSWVWLIAGVAVAGGLLTFALLYSQGRIRLPGSGRSAAEIAALRLPEARPVARFQAGAAPAPGRAEPSKPSERSASGASATVPVDDPTGTISMPGLVIPEPPESAPEPPPALPQPGKLIIGPAWDPAMTVTVSGTRYRLDREHQIEADPGTVALAFEITTPEFSFDQALRLRLKPGGQERVSIPIDQPGKLTVQPHLNTRPGTVRIDGEPAGPTPLRGRWLAPGEHFIEVFALGSTAVPAFSRSLAIQSGVDSVLTFDLDGKLEATVREKPLSPP